MSSALLSATSKPEVILRQSRQFGQRHRTRERVYLVNALRMLDQVSECITVPPNEIIFSEHDPACGAYVVLEGIARLCGNRPDGARLITDFRLPNDTMGVIEQGNYLYTAEAATRLVLRRYPKQELDSLFRAAQTPGGNLLVHCAWEDAAESWRFLGALGSRDPHERIAAFLVRWTTRTRASAGNPIQLPSADDIACHVDVPAQTVSRILRNLARDGIIQFGQSGACTIADAGTVMRLAAQAVLGKT